MTQKCKPQLRGPGNLCPEPVHACSRCSLYIPAGSLTCGPLQKTCDGLCSDLHRHRREEQ